MSKGKVSKKVDMSKGKLSKGDLTESLRAEAFIAENTVTELYSLYLIFTHRGVTATMHVVKHFMPATAVA